MAVGWSSRPGIKAGRPVFGHEWEAVLDQISSLTQPTSTTYTLAWTSTGSAPALGTSTVTSRYTRAVTSSWYLLEFRIVFAGATFGTGDYRFSIPLVATSTSQLVSAGAAALVDTGTTTRNGTVRLASSTTVLIDSGSGTVGATVPFTFANTDIIEASIWIETE